MTDRLSAADVSFCYLEGRTTPQHVGMLAVFSPPPGGLDYDRLIRLLQERIALAPRYRQRIRAVPANLANPVWADDPDFDITYHVRRCTLAPPGDDRALLDLCGRVQSGPLDRDRPLWEMYLVDGLRDGRVAVVTKTHHSMVDGRTSVDLSQLLLDSSPRPRRTVHQGWTPQPEPTRAGLVVEAVRELVARPGAIVQTARLGIADARSATAWLGGVLGNSLRAGAAAVRRPGDSPLRATVSGQRRLAVARTELADYRRVRQAVPGTTVNDVVLAVVAGALRGWLSGRGEGAASAALPDTVCALVPMSVGGMGEDVAAASGTAPRVSALLVDLPVGEPDPLRRLALVRQAMAAHAESGHSVGADVLVGLSGFAPPTLHALGARAAGTLTRRMFSLVVANLPGPQQPMYAAGARLREVFPFQPLGPDQAVSIALASYDGQVCYGITGDRTAAPDVAALADGVRVGLAELLAASGAEPVGSAAVVPAVATAGRSGPRRGTVRP